MPSPRSDPPAADEPAALGDTRGLTSTGGCFFEHEARRFLAISRHVLHDAPSDHAPDRIEITVRTDTHNLAQLATLSILPNRGAMPPAAVVHAFGPQHLALGDDLFDLDARLAMPGFTLGVHSSRMDMATRDTAQDEAPGLNRAWCDDVPMALTEPTP